jgi:hypothetical protein
MWSDGRSVATLVLVILGTIFAFLGGALTFAIITAFVGVPFLVLGLALLLVGGLLGSWRYREARRTVEVLRVGDAAEGRITNVDENRSVRLGDRHPWRIAYSFRAAGQEYEGQVSTLNKPGPNLQPGRPAWVLFSPQAPQRNVLYPHP